MPLLADEVFQEAKPDFTDGTADAPSDKKQPSSPAPKVKATDYFRVVNPDPETFLGSFAKAAVEPIKAMAKAPSMVTMDDDSWYEEIQKESVQRRSAGKSGLGATVGRIAGSVVGGVGEFTGATMAASEAGPAAPFVGPAVAFGASGSWESAMNAGVRAYDQGLPKDKVVSIAKKMAGVGAATGAATAVALGATGLIPRTATALARTGATAAIGAGTGVGSQLVENVAEKDMGLDVSPTEGLLEQAVVMGLLPVVAHAKDLYRQARSVAKSDPAKAKALQQSADDVAIAELRKVDTTPSSETSLTPDQQAKESAKAKVREFVTGSALQTPKGATAPRAEPTAAPETVSPEEAEAAKERMSREATGIAGIEKEPSAAVPSTEPEAERGINVLDEIKQSGARTVADIQRLFPQAQLSREAARKLRDQAWGRPEVQAPKAKPTEAPPETTDDLTAQMESETGMNAPDESNVTTPVTDQSSTGSAPNREPVAPTEPVEPKGKEENALVTEAAQPVQPVREQSISGKGEVPEQSGLTPNDEGRGEASQPEAPAQPTTDPPTITADGPAGDWSYETLKALSVAQRGKLAGDLRRYTKDARLTDKAGLLELGPKKISEVVKDLGARKLKEAQEKASKPVEPPPVEQPIGSVTDKVTDETKAQEKPAEQPPSKTDTSPSKEPESPSKTETPEKATVKVEKEVKSVSNKEGQKQAKRVKAELLKRVEDAMHGAPEKSAYKPSEHGVVEISIPGDGSFKIPRHLEALGEMRDRVKALATSPGIKKGKAPENVGRFNYKDEANKLATAQGSASKAVATILKQVEAMGDSITEEDRAHYAKMVDALNLELALESSRDFSAAKPESPAPVESNKQSTDRHILEEDANDFIKSALASKRPPKTSDEAWELYRSHSGNKTRGTAIVGRDYFNDAWNAFLKPATGAKAETAAIHKMTVENFEQLPVEHQVALAFVSATPEQVDLAVKAVREAEYGKFKSPAAAVKSKYLQLALKAHISNGEFADIKQAHRLLELVGKPDQKYRIGNNPSTYSLIERLPQSEAEKSNGEQPVRVKNDRTGVEETVLEQDLKPVNERTPEEKATAKESKRDLDSELREAKMDPSVFPDEASKREALRRAKAKGWEKFSMRPDSDRSSLEKRIKQYGDTREVQDRNLIDQILRPTLEKQAGQKLVLDPATTGADSQGRGGLGAGVPGSIDARSTAAFERLFGKRLVFYRQSAEAAAKAERHIYGYSTGRAADVIFVDADAPNTWLRVAGHELLHHINKERPDLYRELEDHFIKDAAGKQEQAFDKYSNYPPEEITEEAVADLVGDSVADPKFWDRFASKNPGLFWRAAKTMLDWLDKAAEWLKGTDFGSAEFTKDVDRARSVVADTLAKYSEGKQGEISADWEKFSAARPTTPGTLPPEESKVRKAMDAAGDGLRKLRSTIAHSWVTGDIRRAFASTRDAGDTAATLFGRKMANEVRQPMLREYGKTNQQRAEDALTFAVEAKGDINALNVMRDKILNSDKANPSIKRRAVGAIDFAFDQWDTLQKHAEKYKAITDYQVQQENAKGIDTLMREGYVMHEQDVEFEPSIMTSRSGTGDATGFRKVREHDTYADSIAAGIDPKSLNAVDLLQARVRRGQQLINKRAWVDGLKTFVDPISHNPIATDPSIVTRADGSKYPQAPDGYTLEMIQRQPIAIHKGYEGIISALTDPSAFSRSLGAQSLMKWAGAGKSISLMFDTFHLGRVAFWDSLIKATGVKTFRLPFPSYRKGLTLADYTTDQIRTMAAHGEIPADWVSGLEQEHSRLGHLVKGGYNIGRISDSLYQDFIHNLPVVGKVNRWVFESFQRGAMVETGLLEFERLKSARPDMPDADVGRQVARDLNTRFGNLGRQGALKSRTFQDLARFLVLAPQWNEGLIRSELGAGKQAIQMVADLARGKSLYSGVLLRSVGGMALAQFTANQIINYITRGHPTWENPEEGLGAKLSAWIPDKLGSGSGFFLHPLGLAAETTHLLMRKFEQTGDFHSSLMNYLRSRSSTAMRPMMTFITKQDFLGRNLKPGTVWAQMAADAIPRPIGGQAYALGAKQSVTGKESESFAGQFEKQILSSVGIKTEGAPAPASRISSLAREFNRQKGIVPSAEFYSGDYQPLTSAVALGNEDAAKDAMTDLLKRKTPEQVRKYMTTWTGHPFTGQRGREAQFRATLTPEQKEQYSKAIEQRRKVAQEVFRMLREKHGTGRTVQT